MGQVPRSAVFFVEIPGSITRYGITPNESMKDSTYPHHVQLGFLTKRQRKRLQRLLRQRKGRWTLRVSKWAQGSFSQTGYLATGGSLTLLLQAAFKEFSLEPPLQEFHISF